jgi:hypothetical protein
MATLARDFGDWTRRSARQAYPRRQQVVFAQPPSRQRPLSASGQPVASPSLTRALFATILISIVPAGDAG